MSLHDENVVNPIDDDRKAFVADLLEKAAVSDDKTKGHANGEIIIDGHSMPFRVDDKQLLFIGCALLPNIANYLVNILPQFFYPYVVAYLQDLSDDDNPITVNELYNMIKELK